MNSSPELSRRHFVQGLSAAGFALAVQPIVADTVVQTGDKALLADWVQIPAQGETIRAYRARPKGEGTFPLVLVVQEIFGVHAYIQDVCRRLAQAGYQAVAVDLYQRQGDATKVPDIQTLFESIVMKVPDAQVMADLDAAVAWARAEGHADTARLAVTGFCWGGRITWLYAAHNPAVKAGVAWYGKLMTKADAAPDPLHPAQPLERAQAIKGAVLGLYGGKDEGIPLDTIEAMRAALQAAGGSSAIHVYPEAPHGFHADYRPTYRKDAAEDGWQRLLAWFKGHGV